MPSGSSIGFFESRFLRQVRDADLRPSPFEQTALPCLRGDVHDHGCGLGSLALAAARQGCSVPALDAGFTAIAGARP